MKTFAQSYDVEHLLINVIIACLSAQRCMQVSLFCVVDDMSSRACARDSLKLQHKHLIPLNFFSYYM